MMAEDAIAAQLRSLSQGQERLERMIENEVSQLKSEQIADLREHHKRVADDQRRAWEAIRILEGEQNQRRGGNAAIQFGLAVFASLGSGGLVAAFMHFLH